MYLNDLLLWLIDHIENEFIEFKTNNDQPELIGEYISALSNSAALLNQPFGYLVYGVDDTTRDIIGTDISLKTQKKGNEDLISWLSRLLNPRINFEVFEFKYSESDIVIVKIPATDYIPVKFQGTSFIRINSYKKKLADFPEKESIIWNRKNKFKFEYQIALDRLTDVDVLKLLDYPSYFELTESDLPENRSTIIDKFLSEGFIIKSECYYSITNLGAILFAKDLDKFSNLSRKAARVIVYSGNNKINTIKEHVFKKGYATTFKLLIDYVNEQLPQNEEIEKVFRKNVRMYPDIAIRELVANSLIHQDFSINGSGPMIEIYKNRIEITNPGTPLIDVLRFIDSPPISRNENLASFMRRINICEERGSGIDKTINAIESYQLPAPEFINENNLNNTISILHSMKSFSDMDKNDKIRACYQHACLRYVSREYMTNSSIRERFKLGKNNTAAWRVITDTIENGLIEIYDSAASKKFSRYVPFWAKQ